LLGQSNYSRGRLLLWRVLRARAESGGNLQQFVGALKPWFEFILRYAVERSGASAERKTSRMNLADFVLPGSCLDLTPFNLVETGDALVPIDMEWKLDHVVPLGWITTRSISYCLQIGVLFQNPINVLPAVIRALCSAQDMDLSEGDIDDWLELESD